MTEKNAKNASANWPTINNIDDHRCYHDNSAESFFGGVSSSFEYESYYTTGRR